jgi:hypothetical protein
MTSKFCSRCGAKLTRKNRYKAPRSKHKYMNICKSCHINRMKERYSLHKKKFYSIRGERYTLIFRSLKERYEFITYRRIQRRFGKPKTSPSSRVSQSVWQQVSKETEDGDKYLVWEPVLCDECKSAVRYDSVGYQVCENCGLIRNEITYEQIFDLTLADRAADYNKNELQTIDYYYARAYRKQRRR